MNALDQLLRDLGTELLYSGLTGGLPVQPANQRLQEIVPLISQGQASVAEALAARDTVAVQELRRAVAELEAQRDAELIVIGKAALAARRGNPATLAKIDRLQDSTANSGSLSTPLIVVAGTAALVVVGLLVAAGIWYGLGSRDQAAPKVDPAALADRFDKSELDKKSNATKANTAKANGVSSAATDTIELPPEVKQQIQKDLEDEPDDFVAFLPTATEPVKWQTGLFAGELRPAGEIDRRRGVPLPQLSVAAGDIVMAVVGKEGRVWSLADGKEQLRFEIAGKFWGLVKFALSPDGKLLAAVRASTGGGAAKSRVRVFDIRQRKLVWNIAGDLPMGIGEPSFSGDSGRLICGGDPSNVSPVRVLEATSGREVLVLPKDHPVQRIYSGLTERDTRQWLLLRNVNGTECELYDLRTGVLAHKLPMSAEQVKGFSADGSLAIVETGRDVSCLELTTTPPRTAWTVSSRRASLLVAQTNQVLMWGGSGESGGDSVHDLKTGAELYRLRQSAAFFQGAESTADGRVLIIKGGGIHDIASGTQLGYLPINLGNEMGNPYLLRTAFTSSDRIVSLEWNGRVAVWSPDAFRTPGLLKQPSSVWKLNDAITNVAISPDGQRVAAVTQQGPLRVFAGATATEFPMSIRIEKPSAVLRFVADGQRILGMKPLDSVAATPSSPAVWESLTGRLVPEILPAATSQRTRIDLWACSPDGLTAAVRVAEAAPRLRFCRTETGETISEVGWPAMALWGAQFSADGRRFALGTGNGATIHDVATGTILSTIVFTQDPTPTGEPGPTSSYPILTPDGLTLLRVFGRSLHGHSENVRKPVGGTVEVWDIATQRRVRTISLGVPVSDVVFLDDGRTVGSVQEKGRDIRLWDLSTGALRGLLVGHDGAIQSLDYASKSKTLVSGGSDSTLCFWKIDDLSTWEPDSAPQPVLLAGLPTRPPLTPPMRGNTPPSNLNGGTTTPAKPVAVELTPEQIAARKLLLEQFTEGTLLRGDWSYAKFSGRFSLRVTKTPGDDLQIAAEAFDPSKARDTKSYIGRLELDEASGNWELVWNAVAESGLRRGPLRIPATSNLLLFGDKRTIRLRQIEDDWQGLDSSEVMFRFKVIKASKP